ncbi:MAG: hypothetical protein IPJ48_16900 [Propionivibrio sp.]|uniref:Uncharacterized protein n=1 Tax=Candidatus Propionivibrio dominans TaxID=2954373 RepID=A0A9D7IHT4_9RHOO|nr:hypothetical protein [Candidatus Propionivibrio dominans]
MPSFIDRCAVAPSRVTRICAMSVSHAFQDRPQLACWHLAAWRRITVPPWERVEGVFDAGDDSGAAAFKPLAGVCAAWCILARLDLVQGLAAGPALYVQPLDVAHKQSAMHVGQRHEAHPTRWQTGRVLM